MDVDKINLDLLKARKLIDALDLTPIINRLVLVEKWPRKHALEACQQYKNYLFLIKKYGRDYQLPPSSDIDEVWHAHILHTEDYAVFCQQVFGKFFHHRPSHEMNSITAKARLENFFEEHTQRLYFQETGDYIYAIRPLPWKQRVSLIFDAFKNFCSFNRYKLQGIKQ